MEAISSSWTLLPPHFPSAHALASPQLWDSLVALDSTESDPSNVFLAVRSKQPRIQQQQALSNIVISVRQASKAELGEVDSQVSFPSYYPSPVCSSWSRETTGTTDKCSTTPSSSSNEPSSSIRPSSSPTFLTHPTFPPRFPHPTHSPYFRHPLRFRFYILHVRFSATRCVSRKDWRRKFFAKRGGYQRRRHLEIERRKMESSYGWTGLTRSDHQRGNEATRFTSFGWGRRPRRSRQICYISRSLETDESIESRGRFTRWGFRDWWIVPREFSPDYSPQQSFRPNSPDFAPLDIVSTKAILPSRRTILRYTAGHEAITSHANPAFLSRFVSTPHANTGTRWRWRPASFLIDDRSGTNRTIQWRLGGIEKERGRRGRTVSKGLRSGWTHRQWRNCLDRVSDISFGWDLVPIADPRLSFWQLYSDSLAASFPAQPPRPFSFSRLFNINRSSTFSLFHLISPAPNRLFSHSRTNRLSSQRE